MIGIRDAFTIGMKTIDELKSDCIEEIKEQIRALESALNTLNIIKHRLEAAHFEQKEEDENEAA